MKKYVLGFSLLIFSGVGFSQSTLTGKVINEKTQEPLPFVNITIKNTTHGTTADVEGRFKISWTEKEATVVFSYVGFEPFTYVTTPEVNHFLLVKLQEKSTQLHEVVIRPGDNPALKIIRKTILNKPLNDPENLASFSYRAYNKLYFDMDPTGDSAKNKREKQIRKFADRNHLFISESYTERKYVKPNLSHETVLANRMSGVKDPVFAFLATDFQPFSFYKDFIPLLTVNYLNPISAGSTERYDFSLSDTLYHGTDSVFVIAFEPLPGKTFEGLKGQLYISSDGYALEHVLAQPADDRALIEFRIQQKYEKTEGHWFPVQLNTELRFKELKMGGIKLKYVDRSYLSDIQIGTSIPQQEFGLLNVDFSALANRRDEIFWNVHRKDSLAVKEKNTYHFYDSLGPRLNRLNFNLKAIEGIVVGRFRVGSFYLPLEDLVRFNRYEGTRIGLGVQTGERISKVFVLTGYAGYGIKDKAWKYGGSFQVNVVPNKEGYFKFSYKRDIVEPGSSDFIRNPYGAWGNESLRSWLSSRMDSVKQYKAEFSVRPFHFSQVSFFLQRQQRNPTYRYTFVTEMNPLGQQQNFIASEVGLQWRLAWKERYIQVGNGKVVPSVVYPQINLHVSRGITGLWDGQYNFTKLEARIDQQWIFRCFGKTTLQLDFGKIFGQVPYPYLFNGKGSDIGDSFFNSFVVYNYFQTMGLYEFASDQFAYFFLTHNFGRLTGTRSRYFRPELSVVHNMGIGSLKNPEDHQGIQIKTMEKGFLESGLIVSNIFRVNYFNLFYYGFGAGAFYRYGDYALPRTADNFTFKFVVTATF